MYKYEYDNQEFNENLDSMRSILYSLGVKPIGKISDDFGKRMAAKENEENNLKISNKAKNRKQKV